MDAVVAAEEEEIAAGKDMESKNYSFVIRELANLEGVSTASLKFYYPAENDFSSKLLPRTIALIVCFLPLFFIYSRWFISCSRAWLHGSSSVSPRRPLGSS